MNSNLYHYILSIADSNLILGQRLGELCGHGPNLETDIALTNISLDLLGQVRSYFQYAAKLKGGQTTEDTIAFLRNEREYVNVLLVEQPNTNFAYVIVRQFLYDQFHFLLLEQLQHSQDLTLSAIAAKAIKEVSYHKRFSSDWLKRLGDGTKESHSKAQMAVDDLWAYTQELFSQSEIDKSIIKEGEGVDLEPLKETYYQNIKEIITEATLNIPEGNYYQKGGREGIHTEHLGYLLSDLQYMQRAYPNMKW